jgi:CRISPR-associated protein Cas6
MNHTIDLAFPVQAITPLAADHSYHLYASVSRVLPAAHAENGIGIHPISGQQIGDRKLQLTGRSRLAIRTTADQIPRWLVLAGILVESESRLLDP